MQSQGGGYGGVPRLCSAAGIRSASARHDRPCENEITSGRSMATKKAAKGPKGSVPYLVTAAKAIVREVDAKKAAKLKETKAKRAKRRAAAKR